MEKNLQFADEELIAFRAGERVGASLVTLMEAEFVAAKERTGRLVRLYPDLFASPRFGRLFGLATRGALHATCAVRLFSMKVGAQQRMGAMIGFVVTDPRHRGQGLGMRLMRAVESSLAEDGVELGVLWARRVDLYRTLGWQLSDASLLGRWKGPAKSVGASWTRAPLPDALRRRLNRLRPAPAVARPLHVYDKRPYPADRLSVATVPGAYALIGESGGTGYAFETGGSPEGAARLLGEASRRWPDLRVNGCKGEAISRHLEREGLVAFEANPLAMWKVLRGGLDLRRVPWVPYFDRV
ncbi:MAG: GNAT family N-acetyltransferase [Alphaproteobacteria bacterium]|nr:GNAT family N-acetyltransferase [Alphaproteobacteria bacterium]